MEIFYYLISLCIVLFMVIATYDGIYLHIWKYQLHTRKESYFEHKIHTVRAILFPLIIWLLFINTDLISFSIGITLVALDLITLGVDAFSETDSRKSIGGLSRWEYIIHLFANGLHFAAIVLIIGTKLTISEFSLSINQLSINSVGKEILDIISIQAIPGAIGMALVHLLLITPWGTSIWIKYRKKVTCC